MATIKHEERRVGTEWNGDVIYEIYENGKKIRCEIRDKETGFVKKTITY
jgi:hypothetical protein